MNILVQKEAVFTSISDVTGEMWVQFADFLLVSGTLSPRLLKISLLV